MERTGPYFGVAFRTGVFITMVAFACVLLYELWRKHRRPGALAPEQYRRRMVSGLLLEVDLLLWLLVDVAMRRLPPAGRLAYLGIAVLLLFPPVYGAMQESLYIVRQYARSRAELIRSLGRQAERHDNGHA